MGETKPKRGNPAWQKGAPSPNPGGRPKLAAVIRERAARAVDEHVVQAWIDEVRGVEAADTDAQGNPRLGDDGNIIIKRYRGEHWVKCSELLAGYGIGKPVQPIAGVGEDGETPTSLAVQFVKPDGK